MSKMKTFIINKDKYELKACCGWDVEANEDGCHIVACDCKYCSNVPISIKEKRIQKEILKNSSHHSNL